MRRQRAVGGQRKMKRLYGLPQKAGLTESEQTADTGVLRNNTRKWKTGGYSND